MKIEEIKLKGSYLIEPDIFRDERGYFFESFNKGEFQEKTGLDVNFVQDNQSESVKGVLRGMHFQIGAWSQAKLVRVVRGKIFDVCVDIRPDSDTFGEHFGIYLDDVNHFQLYIPRGFAHGFLVLEDHTIVNYKCDQFYNSAYEKGILYNDSDLKIEWPIDNESILLSDKDRNLPSFKTYINAG